MGSGSAGRQKCHNQKCAALCYDWSPGNSNAYEVFKPAKIASADKIFTVSIPVHNQSDSKLSCPVCLNNAYEQRSLTWIPMACGTRQSAVPLHWSNTIITPVIAECNLQTGLETLKCPNAVWAQPHQVQTYRVPIEPECYQHLLCLCGLIELVLSHSWPSRML